MERLNNKIELNKTNVRVDAHIDPHHNDFTLNKCRGDFNRPHFEVITKGKNGITLVSLVITIVIMLILAGVTIGITIDNDRIINEAKEQVNKTNNRIAEDEQITAGIFDEIKQELTDETTVSILGSITLEPSNLTLEIVDEETAEATIIATLNNISGTVSWTSSAPTVATVDENGKVTTVGAGTTTITASCDGKTATCEVTVTTKTTKVTLDSTSGEIEAESTLVLTATLNVTATENIIWTSSDDTIATVVGSGENNTTGTVTGVSVGGPVTITATYGDKTATCSVTVTEKLLRFTIDGKEYYTIEGWEWYRWINSSYNVDNYSINKSSMITNEDGDKLVFGLWNHPVSGLTEGHPTTDDFIYEYDYTLVTE